jgi:hypothetical protein
LRRETPSKALIAESASRGRSDSLHPAAIQKRPAW